MEWDQKIFRWFWTRAQGLVDASGPPPADPGPHRAALERFAVLVTGRAIQLEETRGTGGRQQNRFYLPFFQPLFASEQENLNFFRLRILLMAAAPGLDLADTDRQTPENGEQQARKIFPRLLRRLYREYPGVSFLFHEVKQSIQREEARDQQSIMQRRFAPRRNLRAKLFGTLLSGDDKNLAGEVDPGTDHELNEDREELEIETPLATEDILADAKKIQDYTLGHNFEKIETLDDFNGQWRDLDQEEDLKEKQDAIKELQFRHRIRTAEQAHSVLSADVSPNGTGAMVRDEVRDEPALLYDEWDYSRKQYRKDYCRVYVRRLPPVQSGYASDMLRSKNKTLERIERRLRNALQERERVRRQTTGEEPDIDALVAARADLHAGTTPDERLYSARRKRRYDVRLSFLIDLSLSTDAYVAGRRALDVEREAILLFGEALHRFAIPFAIDGFYSRTRNDCEYITVKDDSDEWLNVRDRLGALTPQGYTRMGPALRRGIDVLKEHTERQRWIILFTDGKPNDYDRYEGRYGVQDVRQAVREAEQAGIRFQAFAIDRRGRPAFKEMLGDGAFKILPEPDQLAEALSDFYLRLLAN